MAQACVVLGGGGHSRVLIDCLLNKNTIRLHGILDSNPAFWQGSVYGIPVLGGDDRLEEVAEQGVTHFVVGLGSTGAGRERLYCLGQAYRLAPLALVHETAFLSKRASVGRGVQVLARAVVNAGAEIGDNVIINSGSIVEHDCVLADHVHIAPGATLGGGVRVAVGAFVGIGARVREGVIIGERALVGAGAVVIRDVKPDSVVAGVPARALDKLARQL